MSRFFCICRRRRTLLPRKQFHFEKILAKPLASDRNQVHYVWMNTHRSADHGRIVAESPCLNPLQLHDLEEEFRRWSTASKRADIIAARKRILLIFLLIRHTGAKLREVLDLNPETDIDYEKLLITFGRREPDRLGREVPLSEPLAREILTLSMKVDFSKGATLYVDPAFVRRKFYERAQACGFPKNLGSPEMIRKSRGVELMQSNMPLPAVQVYLGHSSPNLTSAYVSFSQEEIRAITASFLERESNRKTSARNSFFGKITRIETSDIQALIELTTPAGHVVFSMITQGSLKLLGLQIGRLATMEVKASWLSLEKGDAVPDSSAENRIPGRIAQITHGRLSTECTINVGGGTVLCAVITTESAQRLDLHEGDQVWVLFTSHAVIVRVD